MNRLMRENRYLQSLIDSWKAEKNPQKEHRRSKDEKEHHSHHAHHKDSVANKSKVEKEHIVLSHT